MLLMKIMMIILAAGSLVALLVSVWLVFVFSSSDAPAHPLVCSMAQRTSQDAQAAGIAGSAHHTIDGASKED